MPSQFPNFVGHLPLLQSLEADAELYVGLDLRGYRSWVPDWSEDGAPILRPVHRARLTPWTPGVNTARCYSEANPDVSSADLPQCPHPYCACGYWGYVIPHGDGKSHLDIDVVTPTLTTGVIHATGDVIMWPRGFRAEKAEIAALAPPREIDPILNRIASGRVHPDQIRWIWGQLEHAGRCACLWCRHERNDAVPPSLAELGERYGVPVFDTFDAMVAQFPPTHDDNEVPHTCVPHPYSVQAALSSTNFVMMPGGVVASGSAMQMLSSIMGSVLHVIVDVLSPPAWPAQPSFTGSTSQILSKWWRWALTGAARDDEVECPHG